MRKRSTQELITEPLGRPSYNQLLISIDDKMSLSKNIKICSKCKKPIYLISFWEGKKKIHEYWLCNCENK